MKALKILFIRLGVVYTMKANIRWQSDSQENIREMEIKDKVKLNIWSFCLP